MRVSEVLESTPKSEQGFSQQKIAHLLGVSPRTIYNWRLSAKKLPKKIGRPSHDQNLRRRVVWRVGRELRRQGYPGWRAVKAGIKENLPDRLIQEYVRKFKQNRRKRIDHKRGRGRVKTVVLKPQVIWSMDSAHWPNRIQAQVIKDRASRKLLAVSLGSPAKAKDILELLKQVKAERGGLPLVLATDNGSAFVNRELSAYLNHEKVVHLRSLPRTPEHNSSVEIAIRELRDQVGDDSSALEYAKKRMNGCRMRASLGYLTSDKFDELNLWSYNKVRERFFRDCCMRIDSGAQQARSARERRMLEREAIYATLEAMGWVKRWRGDRLISAIRSEDIS